MIDFAALKAANAPVHAFIDWDEAAAFGAGPLAGVTLGVKANIMVRGLPWTAGMELHRHRIAARDAEVVARLRAAGAAVLGTLNMQEGALGAHNANPFYGTTHNPHRIGYTPGGSSGGSGAAVAAGLCDLALGTDTMGSVRIPAAYCGVYGLKPTNGAVSHDGLELCEPALDCIGPLARDLDLLEAGWFAMADAPGNDPAPFARALLLEDLAGVDVEPAVAAAHARSAQALPLPRGSLRLPAAPATARRAGLIKAGQWIIAALGPGWRENAAISDELKGILGWCEGKTADEALLGAMRDSLRAAVGDDTVLLMPTAPQAAFAHGSTPPANQADFTCLANISGLPALALPAGRDSDGLPVGVQLLGPAGSERRLIALARTLAPALAT